MPYKSAKQRKFMHAKHPEIAARWDAEYGGKVKKSAWDEELAKSLVAHGPGGPVYRSAVKVGAKGLARARRELTGAPNGGKGKLVGSGRGGRYKKQRRHLNYDADAADNLASSRATIGSIAGRDLTKKPSGVEHITVPGYQNAHPVPWGRKGAKSHYVVGGERFMKDKDIIRHEKMHADKSSWRLAQIQSQPMKLAREEARADTLSGTYKLNGTRSHTYDNRNKARQLNPDKTGKAAKKAQGGHPLRAVMAENMHQQAKFSHEFKATQDKINPTGPQRAYRKTRRKIVAQQGTGAAVTAGAIGGLAYHDKKKNSVKKSAWGVVTKLDQSDVHVVTTMTGPKKLRKVKRKRIVVV